MDGMEIRQWLADKHLTQIWLIAQLELKGVKVYESELSSYLSDTRHGPKAKLLFSEINKIIENYDKRNSSA